MSLIDSKHNRELIIKELEMLAEDYEVDPTDKTINQAGNSYTHGKIMEAITIVRNFREDQERREYYTAKALTVPVPEWFMWGLPKPSKNPDESDASYKGRLKLYEEGNEKRRHKAWVKYQVETALALWEGEE